uniref:Regulator of microtubule dynamics protein 2 isoform X1 n=1 Tax=Camelus bactrianus TaxID=9837 RepID=A0A9W3FHM9_CAMBA|nr:regulator of microtubule dynamics protein 2 isoform X1 [Camelus bactrianus]
MPLSKNKEMILGIMVGTTGISLLLLWFHKVRKPRTAMDLPKFLSLSNPFDSMTSQDEIHIGQGTAAAFQGRQLQILEKLNELLTNMEELKEEIRVLKEAIPKLEEYIQGELGGKITVHKISPQHRARKRRLATVQSSATSNSSEEAESEGGCHKEDQSFQPKCPADPVTSDPLHHGASSVTQPTAFLNLRTIRPSIHRGSSPRGSKIFSSPSNTSSYSSFFGRRHSLFVKFQKSGQSRANFDSQEKRSFSDSKSPSDHFRFRSESFFSAPKLNIISCYESASTFFDTQSSSQCMFNPNEVEIISKNSSITNAEKYINSCSPDYNTKHFMNSETKANSSARRDTVDSIYHNMVTILSLPTLTSCSSQQHGIASDTQGGDQLRNSSLHPGSQSHSRNNSPASIQQHPSQSVTSPVFHKVGFCKNASSFTPSQNEITSDPFEDENSTI